MVSKQQLIQQLKDELDQWDSLLAGLTEEQITRRGMPSNLSLKDVIAHLWAWQQRSVRRLEAAVKNRPPQFPGWPEGLDPESEADLEQVNAWIHASNRDKPWPQVYAAWKDQFLHLIQLSEQISEKDLLKQGRFSWLGGHPLSLVLEGTYGHHHEEHLEPLLKWLGEQGLGPA